MAQTRKRRIIIGILAVSLTAIICYSCAGDQGPRYITTKQMENRVHLSELTPIELKRFEHVANSEISPCGDDVTLAESLFNANRCPLSPLAGNFVLQKIKDDYNEKEIAEAYVARYAAVKGLEIPIDDAPTMGAANPVVDLVVFADYECPFCAKFAQQLHDLIRRYPDKIRLVAKNFPIKSHKNSEMAARAAFAAGMQDKFWEMHDTLFSAIGSPLDEKRIEIMAIGLGLDLDKFKEDMASTAATAALTADHRLGEKLGVSGTPTILVNGRKVDNGIEGVKERVVEEFLRNNLTLLRKP